MRCLRRRLCLLLRIAFGEFCKCKMSVSFDVLQFHKLPRVLKLFCTSAVYLFFFPSCYFFLVFFFKSTCTSLNVSPLVPFSATMYCSLHTGALMSMFIHSVRVLS